MFERSLVSARQVWRLFSEAVNGWLDDRAASMGAALAYYTAFSIAPLLIIAIAIAGLVFGRDAAQAALITQLQDLLGEAGGDTIDQMLRSASNFGTGIAATAIGLAALLIGATTAFVELQDDLDRIWKAEPRVGNGIVNLIRSRLLSFGMVLCVGFLLTVSLVLSAAVAAAGKYFLSETEELLTQTLWIYYSTQIFLLGAEFTHAFAKRHGSHQGARHAALSSQKSGLVRQNA